MRYSWFCSCHGVRKWKSVRRLCDFGMNAVNTFDFGLQLFNFCIHSATRLTSSCPANGLLVFWATLAAERRGIFEVLPQ